MFRMTSDPKTGRIGTHPCTFLRKGVVSWVHNTCFSASARRSFSSCLRWIRPRVHWQDLCNQQYKQEQSSFMNLAT